MRIRESTQVLSGDSVFAESVLDELNAKAKNAAQVHRSGEVQQARDIARLKAIEKLRNVADPTKNFPFVLCAMSAEKKDKIFGAQYLDTSAQAGDGSNMPPEVLIFKPCA